MYFNNYYDNYIALDQICEKIMRYRNRSKEFSKIFKRMQRQTANFSVVNLPRFSNIENGFFKDLPVFNYTNLTTQKPNKEREVLFRVI